MLVATFFLIEKKNRRIHILDVTDWALFLSNNILFSDQFLLIPRGNFQAEPGSRLTVAIKAHNIRMSVDKRQANFSF